MACQSVATFGLVLTIFGCLSQRPDTVPYAVGLYITAAYWFTASTSFANPASPLRARCPTPSRESRPLAWLLSLVPSSRERSSRLLSVDGYGRS
jgi:hypothetical protein